MVSEKTKVTSSDNYLINFVNAINFKICSKINTQCILLIFQVHVSPSYPP